MTLLDDPLVLFNSYDQRMLAGVIIAKKIQTTIQSEMSHTYSLGIATNKLLAKIVSATNKPDKHTLVPPKAIRDLMLSMLLKKVKVVGRKFDDRTMHKP